jgi:hypothetical protein
MNIYYKMIPYIYSLNQINASVYNILFKEKYYIAYIITKIFCSVFIKFSIL